MDAGTWRKVLAIVVIYGGYTLVFAPVVVLLSKGAAPLAELGWAGPLIYAVAFAILAAVLVPSSLMKLVAGALFGFWGGLVAGGLGAFIGAAIPFALVRRLGLRHRFQRQLEQPMWRAMDEAAEANGFMLTVLLRLSLVLPYNLSNYLWGATRISWRDYMRGNLFTFGPTMLYAWWGATLGDVAAIVTGSGPERDAMWWTAMILSLVLTVGGAVWMHRLTQSRLDAILAATESE